ncbi:MAG: very short patch repair endonuclease [Bacteroidetes bacterium]|nr:very short patch repair endonuclease [Bacteroidota bacterium]
MAAVKSTGTRLEQKFRESFLPREDLDLEANATDLYGRPDFVHRDARLAIFLDSCFWHGCKEHLRMPASNVEYWHRKIQRNRRRDRQVTAYLKKDGWQVLRIWEHSLKKPRALKWWLTRIGSLIAERT